jgi:hypothetical protein
MAKKIQTDVFPSTLYYPVISQEDNEDIYYLTQKEFEKIKRV